MNYSLVEWIDENKYSVIPLSRVKDPRKAFEDYKEGEIVKASCHGFSGVHTAKLIAIRGSSTEDKKELERLAISHTEVLDNQGQREENGTESTKEVGARKRKSAKKSTGSTNTNEKKLKTQENKENNKNEKQKVQEEKKKNKEALLRKNKEFLNALDSFKEQTISVNVLPQSSTHLVEVHNTEEPLVTGDSVFLNMDTTEVVHNRMLPCNMRGMSYVAPNTSVQQPQFPTSVPLPQFSSSAINQHFSDPHTRYSNSQVMSQSMNINNGYTSHWDIQRQTQMDNCTNCGKLNKELASIQEKVRHLEEQLTVYKGESTYKAQKDGRPRAGLVPTETAMANHMVELLPKSGVFTYPKDIKVASRKNNGSSIARFLMSVFYSNQELVEAGNVYGANGKRGLDARIVQAIIDYSLLKSDTKIHEINLSMRSKISALVSKEKKVMSDQ